MYLVEYAGSPRAILRAVNDFGFESYDLVGSPLRLRERDGSNADPLVEANIDRRRVKVLPTPAQMLSARSLEPGDNWLALTSRTLARLAAGFLVAEDPQRRLDARKAATLMHQVSLVQHILDNDGLRRVLIGDEVGLGKTIEAGLLMRRLIDADASTRLLYLAPAGLVGNVVRELRTKLDIDARAWVAGSLSDARLDSDRVVVASIHKAVFNTNMETVLQSGPWNAIIVDECHHLSDWDAGGGKPNQSYRLVSQMMKALTPSGRLILMSGTPHQGNEARFKNILRLLSDDPKNFAGAAGRVIFRTKDRVRDWRGAPLFPAREIRPPTVVSLGAAYQDWYNRIATLYESGGGDGARARAAGWAKGQALQWAASSVHAGLGFLVRLAIRRLGWKLEHAQLCLALQALRPYRGGPIDEPIQTLFQRLIKQVGNTSQAPTCLEDAEDEEEETTWRPDASQLGELLEEGVSLLGSPAASAKWDAVFRLIDAAEGEKVVLFAQPVETVTVVAGLLRARYGCLPEIIIGNQTQDERAAAVQRFQTDQAQRFLVSSRAGGEGLNMQRARRLIHLDVPWNPMEMEQRVGRIHRFGSRKTVLVDTVVAAGSREVDMYRVAREKLAMVATHLDPEQFETLFGRVMSLVPPKELESVLANVTSPMGLGEPATQQIGALVTEGYRSWSRFDETYRRQAEEIRAADPGQARWEDLGSFLVRHCGAATGEGAKVGVFEFRDEEIVATEEDVPTVTIGGQAYACGDTGGLQPQASDGTPVQQLGLNVETVQRFLADRFSRARSGIAVLNRPSGLEFLGGENEPVTVFTFLRQRLEQQHGMWVERDVSLHCFVAHMTGETRELAAPDRALVVRACQRATRVKDGSSVECRADVTDLEGALVDSLRRPTEEQISSGTRFAVWPLALLVLTPA